MKIRKIIDKRIHEIEFLKIAQLEKKLINNISNSDILIFDKNIAEIGLIKKLLKRFPKHELSPSVKFEIDYLGKSVDEIPALKHITSCPTYYEQL